MEYPSFFVSLSNNLKKTSIMDVGIAIVLCLAIGVGAGYVIGRNAARPKPAANEPAKPGSPEVQEPTGPRDEKPHLKG